VVHNVAPSISVTHNYVDATNVPHVLHAIAHKISETLCILALEGCPERRRERGQEYWEVYRREVDLLTDEGVLAEVSPALSPGLTLTLNLIERQCEQPARGSPRAW
jgi:hypothetical protein